MVNQKLISFKITLENLENLDRMIRETSRWTRRNTELNMAVEMYVQYQNAKTELNTMGDPVPMQKFLQRYFRRDEKILFK